MVALFATVLFTACSNDEAVQVKNRQEISFRLQGGMPDITTRSLATTTANIDAFVVFGTDDELEGLATPALLFDAITVARQINGSWDYAPKKYYSATATTAGFFAFSPVSANITPGSISATPANVLTGVASFDYTVLPPDGSGNAIQEDLLVAGGVESSLTPPQVILAFKHALARIFVTATNAADDPVIIKKLSLLNLETVGTLNFDPVATPVVAWTSTSTKATFPYVLAPSGVVVPAGTSSKTLVTSWEQGMMVLPQETENTTPDDYTAGDFALEIEYDIANLTGQTTHVYITDGYEFLAGQQYNINITFNASVAGQPIEFSGITVEPFGTPVNEVNP